MTDMLRLPATRLLGPLFVLLVAISVLPAKFAEAQEPAPPAAAAGSFRKLAPGVETTVPAEIKPEETFSIQTILGQPNVRVTHFVQCLEFTFKPLRFIRLQVPDSSGVMKERLVWYLVYHIKQPVIEATDAKGDPIEPKPMRFYPVFWLEDQQTKKVYQDRLIAPAIAAIRRREDPNRVLLNSVEISGEIPPSPAGEDHSVWGVVTWDNIDLRINRFAVYVAGLSTAYKPAEDGSGNLLQKTLQVNFWRPGDAFFEREDEIRLGVPGDVDYRWLYR